MLTNQDVFNAGRVEGLIMSGCAEPSIDLRTAAINGFFTLKLRDKRDGATLILKVTEIELESPKKE